MHRNHRYYYTITLVPLVVGFGFRTLVPAHVPAHVPRVLLLCERQVFHVGTEIVSLVSRLSHHVYPASVYSDCIALVVILLVAKGT